MSKRAEKYFREFYSLYQNILNVSTDLYPEDAQLKSFTEVLFEKDYIDSPFQLVRENGQTSNIKWSILGFSTNCISTLTDQDSDELEPPDNFKREWSYTLYNGYFKSNESINSSIISKSEIDKVIRQTINFIKLTVQNKHVNDYGICRDLQKDMYSLYQLSEINNINITIITDCLINSADLVPFIQIPELDLTVGIKYIDILKWGDIKNHRLSGSEVNIDLKADDFKHYNIPFIKHSNSNNFNQYLAFFPGQFIADIYEYYNTSLLENNVRVFLSANRKANKELRTTIKESPKKFFSYNNGISSTASLVITQDSRIIKLEDFQIVNGGQTTASLHYAWKKEKLALNDVLVPVKITELRKDRNYGPTVSNISRAANTQTAIRTSDFFANHPFLTKLDKLSQKTFIHLANNSIKYFYFERMAGQYNVSYNNSGRSEKFQKAWKREHPSELMFNKIDIARWINSQKGFPHIAAASAEKQFQLFIEEKNFKIPSIGKYSYSYFVGFGLLFKKIRQLIGTKNGRNYPSIISDSSVGMATAIYSAAMFHKLSNNNFNYSKIFNGEINVIDSLLITERIETDIDFVLIEIIQNIWKLMSQFGGTSVQEQAKKQECWNFILSGFKIENNRTKEFFQIHQLSSIEKLQLEEDVEVDLLSQYENDLIYLLENNFYRINELILISNFDQEYKRSKAQINNLIKRLESKDKPIQADKVHRIAQLVRTLESDGRISSVSAINSGRENKINFKLDFSLIRGKLNALKEYSDHAYNSESEIDEALFDKANTFLDYFDNERGFSRDQLNELSQFDFEIK